MGWVKESDRVYSKKIYNVNIYCVKQELLGEVWWLISYGDCHIDKYIEAGEEEVDVDDIEEVLKYADNWFEGLVEDIIIFYTSINRYLL